MTKYIIAIPSYKRANTLNKKTLTLLKQTDINLKEKVYIFVADEQEYKIYKETLNENDYHSIIIGKLGIGNQRNFIYEYFPLNTNIMSLDDDLYSIVCGFKDKQTKNLITKNINSLNRTFESGFEECKRVGASIFGFYPVYNKFFMTNTISYHLTYIVASCYGTINHKKNCLFVNTDDKEDFERSVKCFIHDGKVVRFNFISFKSNYYTEKGGLQETRTLETIKKGAEYVFNKYPEYCKLKVDKKGRYEIVFKKIKPEDMIRPVRYLSIRRTFEFLNLRHTLTKKLNQTTIPPIEGFRKDGKLSRSNILLEPGTNYIGLVDRPRTFTLGYGRRRTLGGGPFRYNESHEELYNLLVDFGKMVLPKDFIFTTITVNKNLKAKAHKDAGNVGISAMITLGDYEGGGLFVDNKLYDTYGKIIMFNGAELEHETEDFTGDRYAIIYYKQNLKKIPEEYLYKGTSLTL